MRSTLHHSGAESAICLERGWKVGTLIVGDEGYGPTIIQITKLTPFTARCLAHTVDGELRRCGDGPSNWVLWCRDWQTFTGHLPLWCDHKCPGRSFSCDRPSLLRRKSPPTASGNPRYCVRKSPEPADSGDLASGRVARASHLAGSANARRTSRG